MSERLTVGICGLGLIGSSAVRGLAGFHHLVGVDPDPAAVVTIRGLGVRTVESWQDLAQCDVVLLTAPTAVNQEILAHLMNESGARPQAVADLGSVKVPIDRLARSRPDYPFVGTHPMAGSERSGAESGTPDLFRGSAWPVIVHADTDPRALGLVLDLVLLLGGRPLPMSADCHDRVVALASHLPHLLSGVLGAVLRDSGDADLAIGLAAGSFRDVSRVGGSPPGRTAEFVSENARLAADVARSASAALAEAADLLGDRAALQRWLGPAHDLRTSFESRSTGAADTVGPLDDAGLRDLMVEQRDTGTRVLAMTDQLAGRRLVTLARPREGA